MFQKKEVPCPKKHSRLFRKGLSASCSGEAVPKNSLRIFQEVPKPETGNRNRKPSSLRTPAQFSRCSFPHAQETILLLPLGDAPRGIHLGQSLRWSRQQWHPSDRRSVSGRKLPDAADAVGSCTLAWTARSLEGMIVHKRPFSKNYLSMKVFF